MNEKKPLNVQCFVKKYYPPLFTGNNIPKLLYVSQILPSASQHPRVMHAHEDFVEILLICSGESDYLIHDKQHHIRPGDLLIYNSGIVHDEISGPDNEIGSYCIAVAGLHMPDLRENALIPDDAGYVFPTGESFGELRVLMEMMFRNLSQEEPRCEAYADSLMHAVLIRALSVVARCTKSVDEDTDRPVEDEPILGRRIKKYIDSHYSEDLSLQKIGEALHVSPYYASHVFKNMSGYSPMQYLLRRRVGEAQTLLITTDLPIAEIAGRVGYDTQSYFNLQFTRHVGMPPKRYRQNYIVKAKNETPGRTKK